MALQKQAVVELVQRHRGQGRTVGRGVGQCGSGPIELLPVEEERGRRKGASGKVGMS